MITINPTTLLIPFLILLGMAAIVGYIYGRVQSIYETSQVMLYLSKTMLKMANEYGPPSDEQFARLLRSWAEDLDDDIEIEDAKQWLLQNADVLEAEE